MLTASAPSCLFTNKLMPNNILPFVDQVHGASAQQGLVRLPEQDLRHQPEDDESGAHFRRSPEKRIPG
jgi:hypothetical protein